MSSVLTPTRVGRDFSGPASRRAGAGGALSRDLHDQVLAVNSEGDLALSSAEVELCAAVGGLSEAKAVKSSGLCKARIFESGSTWGLKPQAALIIEFG